MDARRKIIGVAIAASSALLAVGLAFVSCEQKLPTSVDPPLTFAVSLVSGDSGTADQPLPYGDGEHTFVFDVQAIDLDGSPADWFERQVHLDVQPVGRLVEAQAEWVQFQGGVAGGVEVTVEHVHGSATVWFEDNGSPEEPGSFATGLSPTIYVDHPTIHQVQETDLHITSSLNGDFVRINLDGREAVVTGITRDGFYVTDLSESGYLYAGIYVYSFSRPEVEIGDRIVQLSGINDEFYGFTELGFPSWKVEGTAAVPTPVLVTADLLADDEVMEQYESGLVEVLDVTVCPMGEGFETYGQWAVIVDPAGNCASGEGAINVVSAYTVVDVDPAELVGQTLPRITGNLRYHTSATPNWIIYTRFPDDIALPGGGG
jgi:hypothetical protein